MPARIVTLTSDFGLKDPYVAEMKAVILGLCPNVVLIDVTHEVDKYNIRMGAFMLASAAPYFPKNTIHLAVVDPGVGTERRAIIVKTRQDFFVGPDNGLLILAAEKQGIISVHEITNPNFMLPSVSCTFHGRDVFAPAVAHLADGVPPSDFGPEISDFVKPEFTKVRRSKGALAGEVLHVDGFGNIITNISEQELAKLGVGEWIVAQLPNSKVKLRFGKAYAEGKPNKTLALIGSHGYLEIALNQGNAAEKIQAKPGDKIALS